MRREGVRCDVMRCGALSPIESAIRRRAHDAAYWTNRAEIRKRHAVEAAAGTGVGLVSLGRRNQFLVHEGASVRRGQARTSFKKKLPLPTKLTPQRVFHWPLSWGSALHADAQL